MLRHFLAALIAASLMTLSSTPAAYAEGAGAARINEKKGTFVGRSEIETLIVRAERAAAQAKDALEEVKDRAGKATPAAAEAKRLAKSQNWHHVPEIRDRAYDEADKGQDAQQRAREAAREAKKAYEEAKTLDPKPSAADLMRVERAAQEAEQSSNDAEAAGTGLNEIVNTMPELKTPSGR